MRLRGPHPLPLFLAIAARVCAGDRARLADVLAGLARYQALPPALPRPLAPDVLRVGGVVLRDHGLGKGQPVLVVPSLINPPTVLDLTPAQSLLGAMAAAGLRPLMVDWGLPEPLGLGALVAERLLPLLEGLGEPVPVLGYCLGGTLAVALTSLAGERASRLALLATPWRFSGYEETARRQLSDWWAGAESMASSLGAVPMELLQPAFWSLDEAGLVAKFARLAGLTAEEADAFALLEDWSNTGAPLALTAARELAGALFAEDRPGHGLWEVGGERADPARIAGPVLDIIASRDRIVPPAAALSTTGIGVPLGMAAGHVGMIVGRQAPAMLWAPLTGFLRG